MACVFRIDNIPTIVGTFLLKSLAKSDINVCITSLFMANVFLKTKHVISHCCCRVSVVSEKGSATIVLRSPLLLWLFIPVPA